MDFGDSENDGENYNNFEDDDDNYEEEEEDEEDNGVEQENIMPPSIVYSPIFGETLESTVISIRSEKSDERKKLSDEVQALETFLDSYDNNDPANKGLKLLQDSNEGPEAIYPSSRTALKLYNNLANIKNRTDKSSSGIPSFSMEAVTSYLIERNKPKSTYRNFLAILNGVIVDLSCSLKEVTYVSGKESQKISQGNLKMTLQVMKAYKEHEIRLSQLCAK
jgi:hypothetical protein